MIDDDHPDPWRGGKRGIVRGVIWTLVILTVFLVVVGLGHLIYD